MSAVSTTFLGFNSFTPVVPSGAAASYLSAPEGMTSDYLNTKGDLKGKSGKEAKGIGPLSEKMIEELWKNGLYSDISSFLNDVEMAVDMAYDPITGKSNLAAYKLILPKLGLLKGLKEQFTKALDLAMKNDTLGEIAVSTRGEVYVMDPDKGLVLRLLKDLTGEERVLTNGELANTRLEVAAFNTDMITTIQGSISIPLITKYLNDIISKIGTTTTGGDIFVNADGQTILAALALKDIMSGKLVLKSSEEVSTLLKKMEKVFKYIGKTLPSNMLTVLGYHALRNNATVADLILDLTLGLLDDTLKSKAQFGNLSGNAGSSKQKGQEFSPLVSYQTGENGYVSSITINPGLNVKAVIPAIKYNQLMDANGKLVPDGSLESVVNSGIGVITETSNGVYVGNKLILPEQFSQIYIDTGQVTHVWLPSTVDNNGVEHPDFELLQEYQKLCLKIDALSNKTQEKVEKLVYSSKLNQYIEKVDDKGNISWNKDKFRPYLVFNAFANGENDGWFGDDGVLTNKGYKDWSINVENRGIKQNTMKKIMRETLGNTYDSSGEVYAAIAYLPISKGTSLAMMASGNNPRLYNTDTPTLSDDIRVLREQLAEVNSSNSNLLWQ